LGAEEVFKAGDPKGELVPEGAKDLPNPDGRAFAPNAPKGLCEPDFAPKVPKGEAEDPERAPNFEVAKEFCDEEADAKMLTPPAPAAAKGDLEEKFVKPLFSGSCIMKT
jgi:hypothetical protein